MVLPVVAHTRTEATAHVCNLDLELDPGPEMPKGIEQTWRSCTEHSAFPELMGHCSRSDVNTGSGRVEWSASDGGKSVVNPRDPMLATTRLNSCHLLAETLSLLRENLMLCLQSAQLAAD